MKNTSKPLAARLLTLVAALALAAVPALAETVEIDSAADWDAFANRVNAGETQLGAIMTANVTLTQASPFVGAEESHPYSGPFDGDGHTLTVNWKFTDGTQWVAPFRFTDTASFKNLHIAGSLESNGKFVSGFVGKSVPRPNSTANVLLAITNCRSSVTITCAISGDSTTGGFVGHLENDTRVGLTFKDCIFDGSLLGPSANSCGGFLGYKPANARPNYYNCLFAPAKVTVSTNNSYTFSRGGYRELENCYYMQPFGEKQGTDASSMSAEELASKLGGAWNVSQGKAALARFSNTAPTMVDCGFTYQGALVNAAGQPFTGAKTVEFRLYDTPTGGTPLWGRSHNVLLDTNGLFNARIDDESGTPLEDAPADVVLAAILAEKSTSIIYLGLTVVGSSGEIAPRQRIIPVPYATFAQDLASTSGDLDVTNGVFTAGSLGVTGHATANSLAVVDGVTIGGNLSVGGAFSANGTFPVGSIILWSGSVSKIPDGWALCDGKTYNGCKTPDLRNRFVVGAGSNYSVGATGGADTVTLSADQMPKHSHWFAGDDHVAYVGAYNGYQCTKEATTYGYDAASSSSGNGAIYVTSDTGGGGPDPHENRPPYFALCYIMRVK